MIIYAKIQTSRAALMKFIGKFKYNKKPTESVVAERPLPGKYNGLNIAYVKMVSKSPNHQSAERFKGYKKLDKKTHDKSVSKIQYSWTTD